MSETNGPTLRQKLWRYLGGTCEADMPLIKLRKANETGEDVGALIINTDQIVAITAGQNATELAMADGRPRWVKDTPDEVASLAKAAG